MGDLEQKRSVVVRDAGRGSRGRDARRNLLSVLGPAKSNRGRGHALDIHEDIVDTLLSGERVASCVSHPHISQADVAASPGRAAHRVCMYCGAWLGLGPSNDTADDDPEAVQIEISAARLIAAYEDANDTDDVLADPVCREVIEHFVEQNGLKTTAAFAVYTLHEAATGWSDE